MKFDHTIQGIPCQIEVTHYVAGLPMQVYGSGFGDAHPPEPEEFEYIVLDRKGCRATWLEKKITDADDQAIYERFIELKNEGEL